jgi:hypothetical protein
MGIAGIPFHDRSYGGDIFVAPIRDLVSALPKLLDNAVQLGAL